MAELNREFSAVMPDEDALLARIVDRVVAATGLGCGIRLLSDDGNTLFSTVRRHPDVAIQATLGASPGPLHRHQSESLFAALFDRHETVHTSLGAIPGGDHPGGHGASLDDLRMNISPLLARGRALGAISVVRAPTDPPFGDDDDDFVRDIAHRAALALDNARLLRAAHQEIAVRKELAKRLRALSDAARAFSACTEDVDRLLEVVARTLSREDGDLCIVRRLSEGGRTFEPRPQVYHPDPVMADLARTAIAASSLSVLASLTGTVARSGKALTVPSIDRAALATSNPEFRELLERLDVASLLVMPLISHGQVLAIAALGRSAARGPFTEADVDFFNDMAIHAGLALANSRLFAQVRASERRFARLAESGLIGIVVADAAGVALDANDAFLATIGYTRTHLAEGSIRAGDLVPPDRQAVNQTIGDQLVARGVTTPVETEFIRQDGSRVPVLLGVARLDDATTISIVADLTDRKRAEQALRNSEDQLRHSQKMEAVGRLAGGVAHDFNNLLSVILTLADLVGQDLPPGPMREDLDEIHRAGSRAADLTRQLLLFSQQRLVEPRVVDVCAAVIGMAGMLERMVGEDVHLTVRATAQNARVLADLGQLEQVVMNLVVNARDAMPVGGKLSIEVGDALLDEAYCEAHVGTRPGPHVMVAVTDTGIGMDRATRLRIFEPFFTTKPMGQGTGLGLSTVFGIVRQTGGSVWVYSEVGVGSTFKVYLPQIEDSLDAGANSAPQGTLYGTETILVVEDELPVRRVACSILRRYGYRVVEARDPEDALAICAMRGDTIHLLLSDVVMPGMSGPVLAQQITAKHPAIRVLCMSGYADDAVVRHGLLQVGVAFLQKPLTPNKLARRVRDVLDAPAQRESDAR